MLHTTDFLFNSLFLCEKSLILFFCDKACLISSAAQAKICIILAEKQSVLCAAGHHPVRLMVFLRYKVVDQNADIRLGTVKDHLLSALYLHRRIDSRYQSLGCCLLITGTSVKLSGAEKSSDLFKFQSRIKLSGIDAVIFNGISIFNNFRMFQSRNRVVHLFLNILGKRA